MPDLSLEAHPLALTIAAATSQRRRVERAVAVRLALSLVITVCLLVPESEIRAKLFKAGMIVSNFKRSVL